MTVIMNTIKEKEKRRLLRRNETPEEKLVWSMLRANKTGMRWRRQVSIGVYVADFYCPSKKLVIELDGKQHLSNVEHDQIRDGFFKSLGITVIRIPNEILNSDLEIIYQKINQYISLKEKEPIFA